MKMRPQIGLGCVTFGREIDEAASFALLDHALERGVRHFDTAAAYGGGTSETILGKWLASRKPEAITVATKILPPYDHIDISGSLKRLGVEQIDLLYHSSMARNRISSWLPARRAASKASRSQQLYTGATPSCGGALQCRAKQPQPGRERCQLGVSRLLRCE